MRVAEYFAGTDSRIRVFTQRNAGVSVARNHGIREAKGEYLVFLDSDDWLEDNALEVLLNAQKEHPDELICAELYRVRLEGSTLFRYLYTDKKYPSRTFSLNEVAENFARIAHKSVTFHNLQSKLFRSSYNVQFPEEINIIGAYSEDAVYFIRYLVQSGMKAYYVNKPVLNYLLKSASSVSYKPKILDAHIECHKIMAELMNDDRNKKLMIMCMSFYPYSDLQRAIRQGTDRKEINRIKSILRSSARLTIKCKKYPLSVRLKLFLAAYAPVPIFKAIVRIWDVMKSFRRKNPTEIITNWQDFPKAPGL